MSITTEEAAQIARAYKLSLTDAETLIRLVGPAGTYEDARHLAVNFAGSNEERAGQALVDEQKKQEAEKAAEYEKYEGYRKANPKSPKPKRVEVVPDLSRPGMTDRDRMQAMNDADTANVKAAAEEKSAEANEKATDYYAWAAAGKPEK